MAVGHAKAPPTVSVVLATYDRLRYLRPAVESVFAQTFTDWELIIADDGSEAETKLYLEGLAERPNIEVAWLPHTGKPGLTRNVACRMARGEYIAFLDSDDLWMPLKLEQQITAMRTRVQAQWSYTAFIQIDGAGRRINTERSERWVYYEGQVFEPLLALRAGIPTPAVMVRREFFEGSGGFDEQQGLHEDFDLWLRLALLSEIALVRPQLACVRYHDQHFSSHGIESFEARDRVLRKLQAWPLNTRQRSAVRAARSRNAARLAAAQSSAAHRQAAWRTVAASWRFSWRYPAWWSGLVRAAAHAYLPDRMKRFLRARSLAMRRAALH